MKLRTLNQSGFEAVGMIVAVLLISGVSFAGYKVWHASQVSNTQSATASRSAIPATIKTKADLSTTNRVLDNSASQLDAGLNDSSLDADLNSML